MRGHGAAEPIGPDPSASVALIGMSCRFPGANSPEAFWANLEAGVESVSVFADDELEAEGLDPAVLRDPRYVRAGAVVDDADRFDAAFFGYAPSEARLIDPQQRVFLECAWAALEDARCDSATFDGSIGVFAGAGLNTYLLNNQFAGRRYLGAMNDLPTVIGADKDFLATRVSYQLNLTGPSLSIQTACSTSLVAVAQACQSLTSYQCDVALAGGVTIRFPLRRGYLYESEGVLSPDGHCRAFDAMAGGTVPGNGAGVVVLKRLTDALADGDPIRAVILATAVNNDGSMKVGYTAPSIDAQAGVIRMAHLLAGVPSESVTYVEAHGTGTRLGDPIEVAGLTRAFRAGTDRTQFCGIGSVKTNFGHLDAAAGVAGLMKVVLALEHRQLPPSLNFESPNPAIDFGATPFSVVTAVREWPADGSARRAGVSSFGMGGTNAHAVVEEAPPRPPVPPPRPWQLLVMSGSTSDALDRVTDALVPAVEDAAPADLAAAAAALQTGRRMLRHRRVLVCRDGADVAHAARVERQRFRTADGDVADRPVAFMFPGYGSQWPGMGRELYENEPEFREAVDLCSALLAAELGLDLRDAMWPAAGADPRLEETWLALPALFTIDYALARQWIAWGVRPQALIGHSLGEYVAACLAGVFSLPDAVHVVAGRARLMGETAPGKMLVVPLPPADVERLLDPPLALAAVNGPAVCVVSGPPAAVEHLQAELEARSMSCRLLRTSKAFHSPSMDSALAELETLVAGVARQPPRIPFVSNLTGTWITDEQATDPRYWTAHLRSTVQFDADLRTLLEEPARIVLEVGPGRALTNLAGAHRRAAPGAALVASLRTTGGHDSETETEALLAAVGDLWLAGTKIDWRAFGRDRPKHRLPLPTYPFDRQRHWIDPATAAETAEPSIQPARATRDLDSLFHVPVWRQAPRPVTTVPAPADTRPWLVFADDSPLATALVERLRAEGHSLLTVEPAENTDLRGDAFTLDLRDGDGYRALWTEVVARGGPPGRILHLWGLRPTDVSTPSGSVPPEQDPTQLRGFFSLLFLAQSMDEPGLEVDVDVVIVTSQVHEVTGDESLCPNKATVLGPSLVIPQELPHVRCRTIDLARRDAERVDAWLLDRLVAEIGEPGATEPVAYRGRTRWTRTIEPVPISGGPSPSPLLAKGGVYAVLGGLGGIGLVLARHLAAAVDARLVLVGRTPIPEREAWDAWLATHPAGDPVSARIAAAAGLEALGSEVELVSADVTDRDQLAEALHKGAQRFGSLNGVIHAAGIPGEGLLRDLTAPRASSVLATNVQGLAALHEVAADLDLDWIVLCSSLSSVRPIGHADYSGAHACADTWARHIAKTGPPTVAAGWDVWRDVGMAAGLTDSTGADSWIAGVALTPEEGAGAFDRLLGCGLTHVIVSARDLAANGAAGARSSTNPAPVADATAPSWGGDGLEAAAAELWQELLGVESVAADDNFFDLGGHSLLATQLLNLARQRYGVELTLRSFFDCPTPAGLARLLDPAYVPDDAGERVTREQLLGVTRVERVELLGRYLRAQVSRALDIAPTELPADGRLDGHDPNDYQAELILALKRDLELPLYPSEIRARPSIGALADLVAAQFDRPGPAVARTDRNPSAVFLLCSPRSGSTLLRLMLAGHSGLFCPPELWLLGSERMGEWPHARFADLGQASLFQAFMDLHGSTALAADALVRDLVDRDVAIRDVYQQLQRDAEPRLLVDKTPGYALDDAALQRAEAMFDAPRYLHLTRHPASMIESFVRNRFDRLAAEAGEAADDPYATAEKIWWTANRNIADLGAAVGDRYHRLRFEDLVAAPAPALGAICHFLGLEFEEPMLDPYARGRMLTGPGDPNILEHHGVEPSKGTRWRDVVLPAPLGPRTRDLAAEFGYEV